MLLVSVGTTLPAAAQSRGSVREGSAERWSEGLRFKPAVRLHHSRQARAFYGEHHDGAAPRRRASRHGVIASRYTKRRHVRVAKSMRRHQRTARRTGLRGKIARHPQAPAARVASAPTRPPSTHKSVGSDGHKRAGMQGMASYYWEPQALASGGRFNPNGLTAAHKTLPFGTRVRVTHLGNGRSVEVKINDRGPYVAGRIIDLSKAAASVIGMTAQGVAHVAVEILGK
ncbi:MAG TPA: septal ring lytic transglycosylase RlpA family protein [Hyphomicrobiaceae bacterium]|nr:septal ring lytic transglycosylase RlpA family protein [Hyphomicrobiaceae bacterium]